MAPLNAVPACLIASLLFAAATLVSAQFAPNVTYQQLYKSFLGSAFVYNPTDTLAASNNVTQLTNAGGASIKRSVSEFPPLAGNGLSQTVFTLGPCGLRQPHEHPRASGLLYAIQAANLQVGFVHLDGTQVINNITTGASAIFPQGLVHYQQNLDCAPAQYVITYNDAEAETVNSVPTLLNLPAAAMEQVLGLTAEQYAQLKSTSVNAAFVPGSDPACMARCGLTLPASQKTSGGR